MGTVSGVTHIKMIFSFLASIFLVTHFSALMILLCNSFLFCTFHSNVIYKPPEEEKNKGITSGEQEQWEMGLLLPI